MNIVLFLIILILILVCGCLIVENTSVRKLWETLCAERQVSKEDAESIRIQKTKLRELEKIVKDYQDSIEKYRIAEERAKQQVEFAEKLVVKEFEIESAKRKQNLEAQLEKELKELEDKSLKNKLQNELNAINSQIEVSRQNLMVQQMQVMERLDEEDFVKQHTISLSPSDLKDIELIREFEPRLTRQEAFRKLIWTEFIQKPVQSLCKTLNAEKVNGIYKITNIQTGRMYIGQATAGIASRWKDHCKAALGIGSNSFMTNKFYKAMYEEGIENFTFEILEASDANLNEREAYWIDFYNATTFGYNTQKGK
jgi:ribosome-binding protein aMBF1 (putative translation factor)